MSAYEQMVRARIAAMAPADRDAWLTDVVLTVFGPAGENHADEPINGGDLVENLGRLLETFSPDNVEPTPRAEESARRAAQRQILGQLIF